MVELVIFSTCGVSITRDIILISGEAMKRITVLLALLVLTVGTVHATTHIVKFGGKKYSPKSLTVAVGDTIVWQGDFDAHPLTLTKAPAGAKGFAHVSSGASFTYFVAVPGNYEYICDEHVDQGMSGSFTATPGDSNGSRDSGTKFEYAPKQDEFSH
jgi:plastocyanin